jgi:hypothetical protein
MSDKPIPPSVAEHALQACLRENGEQIGMAAAKPDAELVELLGEALPAVRYEAQRGDAKGDEYRDLLKRIDAKLAELRKGES